MVILSPNRPNRSNTTPFIEFLLCAFKFVLLTAVQGKKVMTESIGEESLSPRRYEILQVVKDHRQVSFDFLKRRFLAVSGRLLRYDLKKLADSGFIRKRGVTRGVVYEPSSQEF